MKELHLHLRRMDVHVDGRRVHFEGQVDPGVLMSGQHTLVDGLQGSFQGPGVHQPVVDEKDEGQRSRHVVRARCKAGARELGLFGGQRIREELLRQVLAINGGDHALGRDILTSYSRQLGDRTRVLPTTKPDFGVVDRVALHNLQHLRMFDALLAEGLSPSWVVVEHVLNNNGRSSSSCTWPRWALHLALTVLSHSCTVVAASHGGDGHVGHMTD
mmetsp:Transcript_28479/g.67672  ORF Transcript_28479/g.67672 Transcript_28479/m.67672 type:complete len:215 (-) Transcript_28479:311-955(-)